MEVWPLGCDVPVWIILATLAVILLYLYGTWPYSFFSERGIPGPKPLPFIGNLVDFFTKEELVNERKWVKQYGKIYGYYIGRQPVLCVHDQVILEKIMVKNFSQFCNREGDTPNNPPMDQCLIFLRDSHWRGMRNVVLPSFTSGRLKEMVSVITDCGRQMDGIFQELAETGKSAQLKDLFGCYALDVISATAFGLQVDSQKDKNDPFLIHVKRIFEMPIPISYLIYKTMPFLRGLNDYFGFGLWPRDSIKFFENTTKRMAASRRTGSTKQNDFLQLLIDGESSDFGDGAGRRNLSTEELVAQAFLFFIAGYETTASMMTFTCFNLSWHPEVQEKVYQEMVDVLGDEEPTYEAMNKLTYLEQCMNETLRMFPPIQSMTREAGEDVEIGGYKIPRGTAINLPFRYIQLDPEIYPEPEVFNPDRFAPEKRATKKPTFMAFGQGPRICLGNRLAFLEAKIALSFVLRKYVLTPEGDSAADLKLYPGPILTPRNPSESGIETPFL
ncbi:cytochrome P450 3A29-like [Liolophura sinensis]|uniref:cytochrome P450 3A29-like n=1 Tax=Liolophura sinensis TaxID=3198878 RepID=UPI0031597DE7